MGWQMATMPGALTRISPLQRLGQMSSRLFSPSSAPSAGSSSRSPSVSVASTRSAGAASSSTFELTALCVRFASNQLARVKLPQIPNSPRWCRPLRREHAMPRQHQSGSARSEAMSLRTLTFMIHPGACRRCRCACARVGRHGPGSVFHAIDSVPEIYASFGENSVC